MEKLSSSQAYSSYNNIEKDICMAKTADLRDLNMEPKSERHSKESSIGRCSTPIEQRCLHCEHNHHELCCLYHGDNERDINMYSTWVSDLMCFYERQSAHGLYLKSLNELEKNKLITPQQPKDNEVQTCDRESAGPDVQNLFEQDSQNICQHKEKLPPMTSHVKTLNETQQEKHHYRLGMPNYIQVPALNYDLPRKVPIDQESPLLTSHQHKDKEVNPYNGGFIMPQVQQQFVQYSQHSPYQTHQAPEIPYSTNIINSPCTYLYYPLLPGTPMINYSLQTPLPTKQYDPIQNCQIMAQSNHPPMEQPIRSEAPYDQQCFEEQCRRYAQVEQYLKALYSNGRVAPLADLHMTHALPLEQPCFQTSPSSAFHPVQGHGGNWMQIPNHNIYGSPVYNQQYYNSPYLQHYDYHMRVPE